jgi:hypothetical protein
VLATEVTRAEVFFGCGYAKCLAATFRNNDFEYIMFENQIRGRAVTYGFTNRESVWTVGERSSRDVECAKNSRN